MKDKRCFTFLIMIFLLPFLTQHVNGQTVLWDFDVAGSLPAGWNNEWDLGNVCEFDPGSERCDKQNLPWEVENGLLVPPVYATDNGGMDTYAVSPPFISPSISTNARGVGPAVITFLLLYNSSKIGIEGTEADFLSIQLVETANPNNILNLVSYSLSNLSEWTTADEDDGTPDGKILIESSITQNTSYRLRIRASDGDSILDSMSDALLGVDDIAVTNGIIISDQTSGDFDFDSDIDGYDFLKWQRGEVSNPPNATDLAAWHLNYAKTPGSSISSTTGIPEPPTFILLLAWTMSIQVNRVRDRR